MIKSKFVECKNCKTRFEMDNDFVGTTICESCDPFLSDMKKLTKQNKTIKQSDENWMNELIRFFVENMV